MSSFRIINEEGHKYKKNCLYVLMFRDGEGYGIDVANSTSNFGRVVMECEDKTKYLFLALNEFADKEEDYVNACKYISSILSYDTYEKMVLSLHTYKRTVEKLEAYAIIQLLGLNKKERIMIGGLHLIEVYTNDEEDILGKFISRLDTGKYMFNFF